MMLVQTPFIKSWECETMSKMRLNLLSTDSSHTQASRSRWFVGSSSMLHTTPCQLATLSLCRRWEQVNCLVRGGSGKVAYRQVGLTKRARARAMRILQPPEKSRVRLACISFVKPRPWRILAALASVVAASSCSSLQQSPASHVLVEQVQESALSLRQCAH